jgi:ATP-dependent Clp protease ATP-binding subunit ClpA
MFERFTDRARKSMAIANQMAQRNNHEYIGTEHILMGVLEEGTGGTSGYALSNLGVSKGHIQSDLVRILDNIRGTAIVCGKMPQTPRAKRIIEYAIEEARSLGSNYVGTGHLLAGLILEGQGVAAQVLEKNGVTIDGVRKQIATCLSKEETIPDPIPALKSEKVDKFTITATCDATRNRSPIKGHYFGKTTCRNCLFQGRVNVPEGKLQKTYIAKTFKSTPCPKCKCKGVLH